MKNRKTAMVQSPRKYRFVLNGNGPISNRGCQAILNGTCKILEQVFAPCSFLAASFSKDPSNQLPPNVEPLELPFRRLRWSRAWWIYQLRKGFGLPDLRSEVVKTLKPRLTGCDAMFSIGGDNYAIDYGYELIERLMAMNECCKDMGIPVVIWGASIGPFGRDKAFEERIAHHFSQIDLIVVREPLTKEYLSSLGVSSNVVMAPDPAFAIDPMRPKLPNETENILDKNPIGLNLSPILAKYITDGDLDHWREQCAHIVTRLLDEFENPVLLIPHVTSPTGNDPRMDDALFLSNVKNLLDSKHQIRVCVSPRELTCEQAKWLISQTNIFIGARMHATIAAFSTGVPCISIAYSPKAWGMNQWLFGNDSWVVAAEKITANLLIDRVIKLQQEKAQVRTHLEERAQVIKQDAFSIAHCITKILNNK